MGGFVDRDFVSEFSYRTLMNYYFMNKEVLTEEIFLKKKIDELKKNKSRMNLEQLDDLARKEKRYAELRTRRDRIKEAYKRLKDNPKYKRYASSNYYEVTSLINSLVGILIFPQQKYAIEADKRISNYDSLPTLDKIMTTPGAYANSYQENNNPSNIIKHLKNSLSHKHIMIFPISTFMGDTSDITHVIFADCNKDSMVSAKDDIDVINAIYVSENQDKVLAKNLNQDDDLKKCQENNKPIFAMAVSVEDLEMLMIEINEAILGVLSER